MPRRWTQFDHDGGIYLAGFSDYLKIGFSTSLGRRLHVIESHTPEPLIVHALLFGGSLEQEQELHRRFAKLRLKNEWFQLPSPLTEYIELHRDWRTRDRLATTRPDRKHAFQRSRSGLPPYVEAVTTKGRTYFYARPLRDGSRTRLPGQPWSPEFMAAYAQTLNT